MNHARVINLPQNPKAIFDEAMAKSFDFWVDEKGTLNNPGLIQRRPSKLTYEEAFKLIQENQPHWIISFRNNSYLSIHEADYWEFGGCNINSTNYGEVFIWIKVKPNDAEEIFNTFNLKTQ